MVAHSRHVRLEKRIEKRKMAVSCQKTLFLLGENKGKIVFAFLWLNRESHANQRSHVVAKKPGNVPSRWGWPLGSLTMAPPGEEHRLHCTGALRSSGLCLKRHHQVSCCQNAWVVEEKLLGSWASVKTLVPGSVGQSITIKGGQTR